MKGRKLLVSLLTAVALIALMAVPAILTLVAITTTPVMAQTSGNVTCTVSGKLIALTVTDGTIAFGTLDLSSIKNSALYDATNNANGMTSAQTQTITNTGNVAEDFNMKTTIATRGGGTDWTLHATTPGDNVFTYAYLVSDTAYGGTAAIGSFTKWTAADSYVADAGGSNVAASGVKYLELEIGMPTLTDDYAEHTITVTVQAAEYTG